MPQHRPFGEYRLAYDIQGTCRFPGAFELFDDFQFRTRLQQQDHPEIAQPGPRQRGKSPADKQ